MSRKRDDFDKWAAEDFNRRANMKDNNYRPSKPGQSAPRSGCVVIGVALVGAALAVTRVVAEVIG